ncbi:hypothetical protein DSM104443_00471 [Usitatibacter rugosus]|uniref:DUF885 domain-containing protein n=1 Tax=Usitatibacter rugosus TaxID=2732067 RepID=A0A6M4GUY6_9PROT|nr:DUF885 domain-containing protein [Usitatibacter rugosus]QJR09427.1 hypothetical protein DSM104443_00471 [Usitatibacter rugosus]
MRRLAALGALAASLAAVSPAVLAAPSKEPAPNAALQKFFDRVFQEDLKENPEVATLLGTEGMNDRIADRSPAGTARRKATVKARITELNRFDPKRLNTQDRISREVMLDSLQRDERQNAIYGDLPMGADNLDGWLLASPIQGVQDWWAYLAKAAPTRTVKDYEDYLKRMAGIPTALGFETERMRAGMKSGWMPPRGAMTTVIPQIEAFAKGDPEQSPLYAPFKEFPQAVGEADRKRLSEQAKKTIAERVQPAFATLKTFVEKEYIPATPEALGFSSRPAGPAGYQLAIEGYTTTNMTPKEIHDLGLSEVARIRGEMDKVMVVTGFKGDFPAFLKFLREDKQFYYTNAEDMLRGYRDIAKRADAELPRFFAELPRLPYGVRPMELHEGDNADHYSRGSLDGTRAGFYEANVHFFQKHPKYDMESTLLHEAVPGHHLQIARAQELKGIPEFRRAGSYNAYQEGWALYAESLGYEMGFYKDPYQRFGALSNEALRACRLVIDTGVHAFGWTREQSIKYLLDNSGVSENFAAAEVDRYIVWPGQALGYKVGELKIKALRAKASAALGDKFDIRRFHNAILDDGALPLTVLEARIDEWIRTEKGKKK